MAEMIRMDVRCRAIISHTEQERFVRNQWGRKIRSYHLFLLLLTIPTPPICCCLSYACQIHLVFSATFFM